MWRVDELGLLYCDDAWAGSLAPEYAARIVAAMNAAEAACGTCGQTGGNGLWIGHGPCPACTVRDDNGEMLSRHQPKPAAEVK